MACQTLVSRVEYCIENYEMREVLQKIRDFAKDERKIEAVEYMAQIHIRKQMFESLIQWVKVVYEDELRHQDYNNPSAAGMKEVMSGSGNQSQSRYEEIKSPNMGLAPYHESIA